MMQKGGTYVEAPGLTNGSAAFPHQLVGDFVRGLYKAAQSRWRSVNVGPRGGEEGAPTGPKGMEGI